MEIIFARHGNTFEEGIAIPWLGPNDDFPLVPRGEEQARELARCLKNTGRRIAAIYSGPLQRSLNFAQIIASHLESSSPVIDARLQEIDFGKWTMMTLDEIRAQYKNSDLQDWIDKRVWPNSPCWGGSQKKVEGELRSLVESLEDAMDEAAVIVVIVSGARIRFLPEICDEVSEEAMPHLLQKVATGNYCKLEVRDSHKVLCSWNISPLNFS